MESVRLESVELDEQRWQQWVQKGKLQDQARRRRWTIIGLVGGTFLLIVIVTLNSILPR